MNQLKKSDNQPCLKEIGVLMCLCLRQGGLSMALIIGLLFGINMTTFGISTVYAEDVAAEGEDVKGDDDDDDDDDDNKSAHAKLSEMNLRQLKSYQRYVYISGSRDPLTFRKAKVTPKKEGPVDGPGPKETEISKRPPAGEQVKYLSQVLAKLDFYLKLHEYKLAIAESTRAIDEVENRWKGVEPNNDLLRQIYERIKSYDRTAKRLQRAKETGEEFKALPLIIKGILWTPKGSRTLINGNSYEAGQAVRGLKLEEGSEVQIEEIDEFSVVFIFKGLRFRKNVGETAEK